MFAAFEDQKSFSWVKSNNIIAFYDAKDRNGVNWKKSYANRKVRLTKNGKTFNATIVDTCGDDGCGGCCFLNSKGGILIDMEYFTVMNNLGSTDHAWGPIDFEFISPKPVPPSCSWEGHCLNDPCVTDGDWYVFGFLYICIPIENFILYFF